ncbi:MAG: hypothetical protein RIQ71_1735 [Verrucomicrobiota bacterium]|jgi:uncharacterized protein (DUF362 family)
MTRLLLRAAFLLAVFNPGSFAQQPEETPAPRMEPPVVPVAVAVKSTVAYALLPASVEGGVVREGMVGRMVDAVVMSLAGKPDIASAWRVFVGAKDRVGIKVSTTGAPVSSTHPAVVSAVASGLVAAGVDPKNIVIWDRFARDVDLAGYGKLSERYRVTSTDAAGGYDPEAKFFAAMMGRLIVGDLQFGSKPGDQMSGTSHLSRILSKDVDKVVNVPALADSMYSGVQGALSSMVVDNLDNWRRLAREPHYGDPYLPELYADPRIGGKVVLTILDALRPQYAGGPFSGAEFSVNYGAIFASRDPVAIDSTGIRLLDDFRKEAKFDPIAKKTKWPESAEALGLGKSADAEIALVRTGLEGEVRMPKKP